MIRSPLGLRLNPGGSIREQIPEAARLGARGVVVDAIGDLAPDRLSETGRREIRHLLRSVELSLVALSLPTRRPFDTLDQLDDRLRRAERAFAPGVRAGDHPGAGPGRGAASRVRARAARGLPLGALRELARRADHRGVRLAIETGTEPGDVLAALLDSFDTTGLAASIDPAALLQSRIDPIATTRSLGLLGRPRLRQRRDDARPAGS